MTIVPAAGLLPGLAAEASKPRSLARSSEALARESCDLPARNWLFVEDEYFPFDADSFDER